MNQITYVLKGLNEENSSREVSMKMELYEDKVKTIEHHLVESFELSKKIDWLRINLKSGVCYESNKNKVDYVARKIFVKILSYRDISFDSPELVLENENYNRPKDGICSWNRRN